jgi:hypothetical protein
MRLRPSKHLKTSLQLYSHDHPSGADLPKDKPSRGAAVKAGLLAIA